MKLEAETWTHSMWNLEDAANITVYNANDRERGYQREAMLNVSSTDNGGTNLAVAILSTISVVVFGIMLVAVFLAMERCKFVKSGKMTANEDQMESADPVLDHTLHRISVDRLMNKPSSLDQNLLQSVTQDLHPDIRPTPLVNYYQRQQHQQLMPPFDIVPKQDRSLLMTCVESETSSCNYPARIWFSVTFDTKDASQQQISVFISKIELDISPSDLVNVDRWKGTSTFVCAYLLPDESHQLRTRVIEATGTCLVFDQTLVFKLEPPRSLTDQPLPPSLLRLSVYRIDHRRLRHTLGHVITTLNDRSDDVTTVVCKDLISDEELWSYSSPGEVRLSMSFDPEANRLKVTVLAVRGISQLDPSKELYSLIELLIGDQLQKTERIFIRNWKTSNVPGDEEAASPAPSDHSTCKETVHFALPISHLDISSVRISILTAADHAGHSEDEDIEYGRTTLGPYMYARADQAAHWTMVTTQPYEAITMWHRLTIPDG